MTQLDLATEVNLSPVFLRHLERGKTSADAATLLQIAECLRLPPATRAAMLAAAGHTPFPRGAGPAAAADGAAGLEAALAAHDPHPALAIDRTWRVVAANQALATLVAGVEPLILRPPVNLVRLFLHPAGLSSRIINLAEWQAHLTARLRRDVAREQDGGLAELLAELRDYPCAGWGALETACRDGAVALFVVTIDGTLSFRAASTGFGRTPIPGLSIETFEAADTETENLLRRAQAPEKLDLGNPA